LPGSEATAVAAKKKSDHASEQDRPDVARERLEHRAAVQHLDAGRQFYVDESAATTTMKRTRARATRGERAVSSTPQKHWSVMTMVAAIGLSGVVASLTYEGATDSESFAAFIEQVLGPQLRSGDVVFMDNLSAHKTVRVRQALEARGATMVLLPPYSPDLNPIEKAWSKVKSCLRTQAARSLLTLGYAIGEALNRITTSDCCGYFRSCGIPVTLH
jgi:transposase